MRTLPDCKSGLSTEVHSTPTMENGSLLVDLTVQMVQSSVSHRARGSAPILPKEPRTSVEEALISQPRAGHEKYETDWE